MAYKDKTTEVMKLASATAQNVIGSAQRQGFLDSMAPRASKIRSSSMNMPSPYGAQAQGSKIRFASNTFAAQKSTRDLWDASGHFSQGSLKGNVFGEGGRIVRPGAPAPAVTGEDQGFGDRPVSGGADNALFGAKGLGTSVADTALFGTKGLDTTVAGVGSALGRPIDGGSYVPPAPDNQSVFDVLRNHAVYGNGSPEDMNDAFSALRRMGGRHYPDPAAELRFDL